MARAAVTTAERFEWMAPATALTGASGLWIGVLANAWPRMSLFGEICTGAHSSLMDHCALCYPAAGLTVAGFALLARTLGRRAGI